MTEIKFVPGFQIKFADLIEKSELFDSCADALEWLETHGSTVLKEQGLKVVNNNLTAFSEERRSRGLLMLERVIKAQVAWLEFFNVWSSNRKYNQLLNGTVAIRDEDSSVEEHEQACKSLLEEHQLLLSNIEGDRVRREAALEAIAELLKEKAFVASVEEHQLLIDRRPTAKDQEWAVKAFDLVVAGNPEAVRTATLVALAGNLEFHARKFFREGSKPNTKNGSTRTVRNGRPAAKRAADRDATAALKAAGGKSKK